MSTDGRYGSTPIVSGELTERATEPRLKVGRAREHIQSLAREVRDFLASDPYEIHHEENAAGDIAYRVRVRKQPPPQCALIAGDAVHNLRAALDLLVWQLVLANGSAPGSYTMFPIATSVKQFEASLPSRIKGASKDAQRLIRAARPYKGGNDVLWKLHRLDANDKHQLLHVVGSAYKSFVLPKPAIFADVPWDLFPKVGIRPADRLFPLKDGDELLVIKAAARDGSAEHPEFVLEVGIGDGQVAHGEPVIETLTALADYVAEFIETFAGCLGSEAHMDDRA